MSASSSTTSVSSNASSPSKPSRLMNSPFFTPRFVPHRIIEKNENDLCYECIDRNSYASVVVRLRKFETPNMEFYKQNIAKAQEEAVKSECLADLLEIIIDEENKISITISENPRGITFLRFVETCCSQKDFNADLQKIILKVAELYKVLNESGKDFSQLPLQHIIVAVSKDQQMESFKIRRPYLAALTRRSLLSPYKRYPKAYPSFVDIASMAFFACTQKSLFDYETLDAAVAELKPHQQPFITELLNAPNFTSLLAVINNMPPHLTLSTPPASECDTSSETSSFGIVEDQILESSDAEYDIVVDDTQTAVEGGEDDDEVKTAIEDDSDDEVETAIEDNDDEEDETRTALEYTDDEETRTAVEDDEDELQTAVGEGDEARTAMEYEGYEDDTKIAIEDDDSIEVETAIGYTDDEEEDETRTALEEDSIELETAVEAEDYEVQTALEDEIELQTAIDEIEIEEAHAEVDFDYTAVKVPAFGFTIPNLEKVFSCHPKFNLPNATLTVEGTTLVYKRQFSNVAYRKLIIHCEGAEIDRVTYEFCYGSAVNGKCSDMVTYKRFVEMCPDSQFCLMEVCLAIAGALAATAVYTFKDYGHQGLTVKFLANKEIRCEVEDQFVVYTKDRKELAASDSQDKMPAALNTLISDLSKMAENFEKTFTKKFTVTFTEQ